MCIVFDHIQNMHSYSFFSYCYFNVSPCYYMLSMCTVLCPCRILPTLSQVMVALWTGLTVSTSWPHLSMSTSLASSGKHTNTQHLYEIVTLQHIVFGLCLLSDFVTGNTVGNQLNAATFCANS